MESLYPDGNELDEAAADLFTVLTAYEEVYTEIGMKFGAKLLMQLLHTDDCVDFEMVKPKCCI